MILKEKFIEEGYNVIALNFDNAKYGDSWNPLRMPYELYINNDRDKSVKLLEDLGYYLFYENNENVMDPFWNNSVIDYFTGLCLYLFEFAKKDEINLLSVVNLNKWLEDVSNIKKFMSKIKDNNTIYSYVIGTLKAPNETRGSILSVFNQKIKKYTSRENLINMLSGDSSDLSKINKEKTALFIISGSIGYSNNLIPLLVTQIIEQISINGNDKNINILFDEFDSMVPIKDFYRIIEYCRSLRVKITVTIKSYAHLCNMYSKKDADILKMSFGNIIYLLSDDIYTLEEISKYCGMKNVDGNLEPLITVEELKTLDIFEAIILVTRMMPMKVKLLPAYKIDWGYEDVDNDIKERKNNKISIYNE